MTLDITETLSTKAIKNYKGIYSNSIAPLLLGFYYNNLFENRNVFVRFDGIPSMTLKDIEETVYTKAIKNYKGK